MSSLRILLVALGALVCALAVPVHAQETLSAGEKSVANFAFATQLGSGIYTIDGRTIQIYRLPLSYTLRPESRERFGIKLTFPMTIGFYDFKPMDVVNTGLPDSLDTVSLVPGVEFRVLVRDNVIVKPFVEGGVAREGASSTEAWVYSGGLRTLARFHSGKFDVDLGNGLLYSRVDPDGGGIDDDFSAFDTAVHARHGMGVDLWNREMEWGLYASLEFYFDEPQFPIPADGGGVTDLYEVGATIGPKEAWKIWKIKLPKLGIGYRFGSNTAAIRFVIGTPSPVLKR